MKGLTMEEKYKVLMAKTSADWEEIWLPLWMHLKDTAGVMKKLVRTWVPDAVCVATGLEQELFSKTAIFLAAIHDIGKATSYFQGIITKSCPEKYNEIISEGFEVHKEYRDVGKTPHAHAGQWILQSGTVNLRVYESLAMVVGAHHGKPISIDVLTGEPDLLKVYPVNFYGVEDNNEKISIWKGAWHKIIEEALNLAGIESIKQLPVLSGEAQILFSGLVIIADWIASNTKYFPLIALDEYGTDTLYPKRVNDGWNILNFPKCQNYGMNRIDKEIFKERFGFLPNEIQKCMLDVVNNIENPGIFILEAQMGVGKTEAALSAAEVIASRKKEGGIFFGLPTHATSNGLFKRLCNWGEKVSDQVQNSIRLAHAAAEFNEEYNQLIIKGKAAVDEDSQEGITVHPWFQGNKRALLADFVIGTIDQFLMASLRRKHFMLRHIGLAGKVVIIDECHAYDAYMNEYLERSLQWMAAYGVPVILLSATLPFERRKRLVECYIKAYSKYYRKKRKPEIICGQTDWSINTNYPLLTWTDGETIKQTVIEQKIEDKVIKINHFYSIKEMVHVLDQRLQEGGCACIIVNTVKCAQNIYKECKNAIKDAKIILYHAQFTMPDRVKKEKKLLEKMGKNSCNSDRYRLIIIGTQVLEQSLDYDADIMVTQLCPMDLLLQRIGRLHRHKRDGIKDNYSRPQLLQIPECFILQEDEEIWDSGTQEIYGEYLLTRTNKILPDKVRIPSELPDLVQKVYNFNDSLGLEGEKYKGICLKYEDSLKLKRQSADRYLLSQPPRRCIDNILDNQESSSDKIAEASVRDGISSIEVLLMKKGVGEEILFVGENSKKEIKLLSTRVPDHKEGRRVATQRLKLPHIFSYDRADVIRELEDKNRKELAEWQMSPWLQGELILLLDENGQVELNGYLISYSFEKGLEYKKKEEENGGKGV